MVSGKSTKKVQKNHLKPTTENRKVEKQHKKKDLKGKTKKSLEGKRVVKKVEKANITESDNEEFKGFQDSNDEDEVSQENSDELSLKSAQDEEEQSDDQEMSDDDKTKKSKSIKKSKKSLSKQQDDMMESLEGLKETDPEFYKYLKQNDQGLLDFQVSDLSDGNDDDEEKDSNAFDSESDEGDKFPEEVDEDEDEDEDDQDEKTLIEVTSATIEEWKSLLTETHSISALKEVIQALQDAIDSSNNKESAKAKFAVTDPDVFNDLLRLSLFQSPETIQHHIPTTESESKKKVVTNEKKLAALSSPLKNFANCLITILRDVTDKTVAGIILKSLSELLPYFMTFNKQIRALVEAVAKIWSTTEEDGTRLYAFAFLKTTAEEYPAELLESILKATYSALIKYSRQSNIHTMGGINFQKNSAATLYGIEPALSYRLGFQYIRQLAVHLRSGLTNKTTDAFKVVYNWQYVHSLDFWSRVLSFECEVGKTALRGSASPLQELIYPLVQVTLGTIRLVPTAQYFPLRFYLIRSLLRLSQTTGVFIPIVPLLTEIFNSTAITKNAKGSSLKALDFEYTIRASKSYIGTKIYQDGVCDQVVDLFGEFFALHSKSIAFPELATPVVITLRRFTKRSKNAKFNKQLLRLVDRLEDNSKFIQVKRNKADFGPTNLEKVSVFLKDFDWEKTPIGSYVVVQRQIKEERLRMLREAALDEKNDSKNKKKAIDLNVGSFESDEEGDDAHDVSDQEPDSDEEMDDAE